MTVHQDYEIKINLNELIEKRIPCCDLLHPDHCLTEKQVSEIAWYSYGFKSAWSLQASGSTYYGLCKCTGIDNKDHWVEPHLPDLERDLKKKLG